jgi:catechol 2,3-dioxygenase-like lactoylglutathione lyase family enzyme
MAHDTFPIAIGIDHLIVGVRDLDASVATYRDRLGFHVSGGGVHPQFGTANRLIVLDNCYLELLAAQPGAEPRGFIAHMIDRGYEGWVGFALEMDDPDRVARYLAERGHQVDGPADGRLATTTGHDRSWRTVRLRSKERSGLPFLIRHTPQGQERRRLLAGAAGLARHPLGARTVESIVIAVHDLQGGIASYNELFGIAPAGNQYDDAMLQARLQPMRLPSGTAVILASPKTPSQGPVAAALATQGEGLFAVTFGVDDLPTSVGDVRARGVGVRVDEPNGILVAAQLNHLHTHGARVGLVSKPV